jgi:hypothetical protein
VRQHEAGAYKIECIVDKRQTGCFGHQTPDSVAEIRRAKHGLSSIDADDETCWSRLFRGGTRKRAGASSNVKDPVANFDRDHRAEVARRWHKMRGNGYTTVNLRDVGVAVR